MSKYRIVYKEGYTDWFYYLEQRKWWGWKYLSTHGSKEFAMNALVLHKQGSVVYEE